MSASLPGNAKGALTNCSLRRKLSEEGVVALEVYCNTEASALLEREYFAGGRLYQFTKPLPYVKIWVLRVLQYIFPPLMSEKDKSPKNSKVIRSNVRN